MFSYLSLLSGICDVTPDKLYIGGGHGMLRVPLRRGLWGNGTVVAGAEGKSLSRGE